MKITYECQFCGFRSQNKEEVQRCEAQGVKSKFSVGEEVEYLVDKKENQWGRAKVQSVLFKERTHEIFWYVIKPYNEIAFSIPWPTAFSKQHHTFVVAARQVEEEELRPVAKEENERIEAVNSLVRACIEKGAVNRAKEAAQLGGRNLSTEEINSLVGVCVKNGWLQDAQKAAQLGGRELTAEEINLLAKAYAKAGQIGAAQEAAKLAGRELTTEEIDSLVRAGIAEEENGKKYRGEALNVARLGASKEVLNSLVKFYIERDFEDEAREAAKLAGRELTKEENEAMIKLDIKYGYVSSAQRVAQLAGRNLTQEEIDSLAKACVSQVSRGEIHYFESVFEVAKLGASKGVIDSVVGACIKIGQLDYAQQAAKQLGRELTTEEIDSLVRACIKNGQIYEHSLKEEALKAARLGASKEVIESLVGIYIEKGWIDAAQEAAKLARRELTAEEIRRFRVGGKWGQLYFSFCA